MERMERNDEPDGSEAATEWLWPALLVLGGDGERGGGGGRACGHEVRAAQQSKHRHAIRAWLGFNTSRFAAELLKKRWAS